MPQLQELPAMVAGLTAAELAACTTTLAKLSPADIELPELSELYAVGKALFASRVIKERFQGEDVVAFFKQQGEYRKMVKRLQKLHKEIDHAHASRVDESTGCSINSTRLQRTLEVAEHGLPALSSAAESQRLRYGAMLLNDSGKPQLDDASGEAAAGTSSDMEPEPEPELPPPQPEPAAAIAEDEARLKDVGISSIAELRARYPKGSFRRVCGVCKRNYEGVHHFYHELCVPCGDFNHEKRHRAADLSGQVALLTGGRVRIGYQIALRLLRCGAECHVTSRFVADAALRFSLEHDYEEWRENLHLYYLELCDLQSVEQFAVRANPPFWIIKSCYRWAYESHHQAGAIADRK